MSGFGEDLISLEEFGFVASKFNFFRDVGSHRENDGSPVELEGEFVLADVENFAVFGAMLPNSLGVLLAIS